MDILWRGNLKVTISRWGNSLAVRLPKDALERAGLREGDLLDVVSGAGSMVLVPHATPPSLDELIALITPENSHSLVFDTMVGAELW